MTDFDLEPEVKPYLKYSAFAHAAMAIAFLWTANHNFAPQGQVYRIDFIGPSAGIMNRELESAAAAQKAKAERAVAAKPSPMTKADDFTRRAKHHRTLLPRPSVLGDNSSEPEEKPAPAEKGPAQEAPAPAGQNAGGTASADVMDMPNFPYPWYITQVRTALWNQWSSGIPAEAGEAMVSFTIMREGKVVDLRIESSSGDRGFDRSALGAVQAAAPFPPLPREFTDSFLKVHVKFSTQQ